MHNIAVFASGNGSNFEAIAREIKKGRIKARLSLLVCDNPKAGVLSRAKRYAVKVCLLEKTACLSREEFEGKIISSLKKNKITLIVLAGFMRILSPRFVKRYKGRILNIHPALLPAFKGGQAIKDAFRYAVKVTGITVHFVDEKMDHGPIILQEPVLISKKDTLESLEEKIHKIEHRLYPQAINLFVLNKLRIKGRRVIVS